MTLPRPDLISEDLDFYVPSFEVVVGGRALPRNVTYDITQVTYQDNLREIDSFEISINNWDPDKLDFKYVDNRIFDPGQKLDLWMGYFGKGTDGKTRRRLVCRGEITSLKPSFPSEGRPTLTVSGLNVLHSLRRRQESHTYQRMTDNQIARRIGSRLNVDIDVKENASGQQEEYRYLFQDNQYDIIFLMERARRIGYDLFVLEEGRNGRSEPSKLFFGPSQEIKRKTYELEYGRSLIEFQPNLTTAKQVGKVTVRGWDATRKEPINVTVTRQSLGTRGVGRAGRQEEIESAFNEREEIIVDRPIASRQEALTLARETLRNNAKDMVRGSGSVIGLPDLRAGCAVEILGLGERFSGRYFITATTHTIGDGGYTTRFECRREEIENSRRR